MQAVQPEALQGGISGVVWRDFTPAAARPGRSTSGELGTPRRHGRAAHGSPATSSTAPPSRRRQLPVRGRGRAARCGQPSGAATFAEPYEGVTWLGAKLITPAIIIRLHLDHGRLRAWSSSAPASRRIPRDVLEAARTDGATRVAGLPPRDRAAARAGAGGRLHHADHRRAEGLRHHPRHRAGVRQDDATTLAFVMWRVSFSGQNHFGVGSAIAVFLFLLVIPILILNIRRFRSEAIMTTATVERPQAEVVTRGRRAQADRASSRRRRSTSSCCCIALLLARADHRALRHLDSRPEPTRREGLVEHLLTTPSTCDARQLLGMLRQREHHPRALGDGDRHDRRDDPADHRRVDGGLRVRVDRVPRPRLVLHRRDRAARRADPDRADPDLPALQHVRPVRHACRG